MIDHIGFEVSELTRSSRFYDAVFHALGARRILDSQHAIAYGLNTPAFWIVVRGREPASGYGHVALQANGKAAVDAAYRAGITAAVPTTARLGTGRSTGAAHTPPISATPTVSASRSSPADSR